MNFLASAISAQVVSFVKPPYSTALTVFQILAYSLCAGDLRLPIPNRHVRHNRMFVPILARHWRGNVFLPSSLVHASVDHDDVQFAVVLQDVDVFDGVAVDEQHVGVVAGLDLAHFIVAH